MVTVAVDYQPKGREGHTSHVIEGNLYMWGGAQMNLPKVHNSEEKMRFTSCVEVLDLYRGKWWQHLTSGKPPLAVFDYSSTAVGNEIYYFGGYCFHENNDGCYHNSLYKLNVETKKWSEVSPTTSNNGPMKKSRCGMTTIKENLLVIGGFGPVDDNTPNQHSALYEESSNGHHVYTNEIHYYNLSNDKWISVKSTGQCPSPRCAFTITSVNDDMIILFGGETTNIVASNDIYIGTCSSSTISWEKISPPNDISVKWPKRRRWHAATLLDEYHLYLLVGEYITNDSWIFDINRRTWNELTLPQSVTSRQDQSLSVWNVNSSIAWLVVFGGTGSSASYLDSSTSVIELRRSEEGKWSMDRVMTHPLEDYEEKLKKINPYIILLGKCQQELQHLCIEKQQIEERLHEQERILHERQVTLQEEKDQLHQEKDYLLHHQQLMFQEQLQQVSGNVSELQKQVYEKDSHIARLYIKLRDKGEMTAEPVEHSAQQDNTKPSIDTSHLAVHDNVQFTLDDVSKLMVILQPVEDDWYQLGHHLNMEESTLSDMKESPIKMEHLLQRWCSEGESTLMKLENALIAIGQKDLILSLREVKSVTRINVSVQFNFLTTSTDSLDGLNDEHIAGKKLFIIQGDGPQLIDWEEYGLRIGVSKGSLPSSETAEIAIVALVGGHFVFPKKMQLVSAIYAVSISKALDEPLRLDVQHCVNIRKPSQRKYLKFAIAPLNRPSVPYQFEVVEGGEFSVNSFYGSIHRQKFSLLGIFAENNVHSASNPSPPVANDDEEDTSSDDDNNGHEGHNEMTSSDDNGSTSSDDESTHSQTHEDTSVSETVNIPSDNEEIKSKPIHLSSLPVHAEADVSDGITSNDLLYVGMIFYESNDLATFATAKHLDALIQYIKDYHCHAELCQNINFCFNPHSKYIELIFDPDNQEYPCTGWIVAPHIKPCQLYQDHINRFGSVEGHCIPSLCKISVYTTGIPNTVPVLHYGIPLEGVDPPVTVYIHRSMRTPNSTGAPLGSITPSSSFQPSHSLPSSITKDQLKSIVGLLKQVLHDNQVDLHDAFQESLGSISREMSQCDIITREVQRSPSYDAIISSFEGGMKFKRTKRDIEGHCVKFLKALVNTGGPVKDAAVMIQQDWIELVRQELSIDLELSF